MLKIREAAIRLGAHPNTVRRLIARGELPAFRLGRVVRIKEADVESYMRRHGYTARRQDDKAG